jgi:hypothetical protein
MGGDDELGASADVLIDEGQRDHAPLDGQGCLWLVEQVEAGGAEPMPEKVDEGFAVRAGMQAPAAVRREYFSAPAIDLLDLGGDVVEAFGPQEEAAALTTRPPYCACILSEFGLRRARTEPQRSRAAFRVQAECNRDRLDQRRLPAAVFSRYRSDARAQIKTARLLDRTNQREVEGISAFIRGRGVDDHPPHKMPNTGTRTTHASPGGLSGNHCV